MLIIGKQSLAALPTSGNRSLGDQAAPSSASGDTVGLGVYYVVMTGGQQHWAAYLTITGPAVLIGVLFGIDWMLRKELRGAT